MCSSYSHRCGAIPWNMVDLPRARPLKKTESSSLRSHRLPIAHHLGVGAPEPLFFLFISTSLTLYRQLQLLWVQEAIGLVMSKRYFSLRCPHPLVLTIFLLPLPQWSLILEGKVDMYVPAFTFTFSQHLEQMESFVLITTHSNKKLFWSELRVVQIHVCFSNCWFVCLWDHFTLKR